jgi:two-component system, response regulator PdtaR
MSPSSSLQVLIVEDDPLVALDEAKIVESFGHRVVGVACDTAEAMDLVRSDRPSVALLDVNLADGPTGPMLCAWLVGRLHIPVVFVTGSPEQLPPSLAGALGYIVKPFGTRVLGAALAFAGRYGHAPGGEAPAGMIPSPELTALDFRGTLGHGPDCDRKHPAR